MSTSIITHSYQITQVLSSLQYSNFQLIDKRIFVNGRPYDRIERARINQRFRDLGMKVNPGALRDVVYLLAAGWLDLQGNQIDKPRMDLEKRLKDFEENGINRIAFGYLVDPGTWVRGITSVNGRRCKRYAEHLAVVVHCPYCQQRHFHYWKPDGPPGEIPDNLHKNTTLSNFQPDHQPGKYHGHYGTMFRFTPCRQGGDPVNLGYTICIQLEPFAGLEKE